MDAITAAVSLLVRALLTLVFPSLNVNSYMAFIIITCLCLSRVYLFIASENSGMAYGHVDSFKIASYI